MTWPRVKRKYFALRWWREALGARWRVWRVRGRFERRVVDKHIEGEPCRFLIANPTGEAWYGGARDHQSRELRFVKRHMLQPGMTVFEVGGHHGHDTLALARWVGREGRVVVFEPVPENADIIRQNCALNELDQVEVVEVAVGASVGAGQLSGASNGKIVEGDGRGIPIAMTTLDRFCAERALYPDLVKIDVEGYELAVLEGAREVLRRRPQLQLEIHADQLPDFNRRPAEIWAYVDAEAYELWVQPHDLVDPAPATGTALPPGRSHLYCVGRGQRLAA